jgi:hypothetical protein
LTEDACECPALRPRKFVQLVEHLQAELMKAAIRELHLPLDAEAAHDLPTFNTSAEVFQERGLSDPGVTAQDDGSAATGCDLAREGVKPFALGAAPHQVTVHRSLLLGVRLRLDPNRG